jgi:hypothetical protein
VAQKFLNGTEIGAAPQEVGGKAVAESVGAHLRLQRQCFDTGRYEGSNAAICQSTAATIEEESVAAGLSLQPSLEVGFEGATRLAAEENDPFLSPLSDHSNGALVEVERRKIEADELGAAQAGGVEKLEDGPTAQDRESVAGNLDQQGDVGLFERLGNPTLESGRKERLSRVPFDQPLPAQVAKEGAQGGELARRGNLLEAKAMEACEEGSDQEMVHVLWVGSASELLGEVQLELREVTGVGAAGVRRGVPLVGQVANERVHGPTHRGPLSGGRGAPGGSGVAELGEIPEALETFEGPAGHGHALSGLVLDPRRQLG